MLLTEEWIFKKTLSITKKLLSYASSKVDYSVGENIYMLPSDMNLNIRSGTVGYNDKILVSDITFSLRENGKVNSLELAKISHKVIQQPTITRKNQELTITHNEEENCLDNFSDWGLRNMVRLLIKKDKTQVRVLH